MTDFPGAHLCELCSVGGGGGVSSKNLFASIIDGGDCEDPNGAGGHWAAE